MEIAYRLRDGLSFCWVEGHPIFLDTLNDRYFRLPIALERTFAAFVEGDALRHTDVNDLVRCSLLTESHGDSPPISSAPARRPSRSAIEDAHSPERVRPRDLLEVFATIYSVHMHLQWRKLKDVLAALGDYREHRAPAVVSSESAKQRLFRAASTFRHARLYVPVKTTCLLDSLALVKYLAHRDLRANLVFGVACDPFSAHCWVQAGDLVLNDTVGNANAHTPIRVI